MKLLSLLMLLLVALMAVGCDDDNPVIPVDKFPATPQGVYSVTGDDVVYLYWNGIYEHDVNFYRVYRSLNAVTGYAPIADVDAISNPDLDLLLYNYNDFTAHNGNSYWYAVTAIDNAGQESELSAEDVFDTPRPEGDRTLLPNDLTPAGSGFNFAANVSVDWTSATADIFVDRLVDTIDLVEVVYPFLNAGLFTAEQTDIQDMGYTDSFDEITWAPADGWSELGYVEAIRGHTYVIWTGSDNYAKLRITSVSAEGSVSFHWGYQTLVGNLELAPMRPERDEPQPKSAATMQLLK